MNFKKILPLLFILFAIPVLLDAQVTTSSISGSIKQSSGEGLSGATITAIHVPSGARYQTISTKSGSFTLPGLRPGGPYTVSAEFVGLRRQDITDVVLTLGDDYSMNLTMVPSTTTLTEVVVSGGRAASNIKTGASTNVGQRQINTLPTITRNITDFTRLTPQANGNNIAGRDGRYNNFTVDGANLNNNFGLSTDPLPGGNSQPISLDAIEEVSVNIAPADVRQSNFTGANIASITKSGSNIFKATVFGFFKDQSFIGTRVLDSKLPKQPESKSTVYGASVGGPIIKNKLFFFVNGEQETRVAPPLTSFRPKGGSGGGNVSNVHIDSLRRFSDSLRSKYGYETGSYDGLPNANIKNYKILARIDWNINTTHKLTVKYSRMVGDDDRLMSSSVPNGAQAGGPNTWAATNRFSTNGMSFANSQYSFRDIVQSASLEINSNWKGKFSNQIIATGTKIQTTRSTPGGVFPFIDIMGDPNTPGATYASGAKQTYMSAGQENFSNNNEVKNDIYNITDNFNYYTGKHTLTLGGTYEYQYVGNMFMPGSQSYYAFGSLQEFFTPGAHPIGYTYTFSRIPGKEKVYSAEMKVGQLGIYAQDEVNITPRLKLIVGLRVDKPVYPSQPLENPAITALTFPDRYGKPTHYSTGMWPKATLYYSPRINVRWDMNGDKSMIVRVGTGVFTGKIPFVYLTNMPTNSGMYQVSAIATAAQLNQITFSTTPNAWQSLFPVSAPAPNTAGFVLIDKKYKFPQVWRTNLGFDKRIGRNWTLTMDALYTKDMNATVMRNANELVPTGTVNLGGSTRPSFIANTNAARRLYPAYANAIILENNNAGGSFSITAQVSKSFVKGFYASLAYTYSMALDVTANPGSTASSTWGFNNTSGTQNTKELSYSSFAVPHRILGTFSYRKEFVKHLGTTFSLYYEGSQQQGGRFSYIYGGAGGTAPAGFSNGADINYDGNSSDLMYIPRNPGEITFIPLTVGSGPTAVTYTAQQQSDAFFAYVEQDKYLKKHKGMVAERNGVLYPFYHRVDMKFIQDIFTNIGSRRITLQFTADCTNFLNLVNRDWGVRDFFTVSNPLRATKNATTGEVRYQLATYTPNNATAPILVDKTFISS
ncbi:MAG TPA: carboxypeptidase regulatory-like domain-containing protein, partial [Ferruginibacter sp.]|nr:carboxypeptidase regulatory-like domain-containing protein [Ferruginibacter sp.]